MKVRPCLYCAIFSRNLSFYIKWLSRSEHDSFCSLITFSYIGASQTLVNMDLFDLISYDSHSPQLIHSLLLCETLLYSFSNFLCLKILIRNTVKVNLCDQVRKVDKKVECSWIRVWAHRHFKGVGLLVFLH